MSDSWRSAELGVWLAELGLGAHAAAFATNGIGWDVLGELSEQDLKELGLSLGDRKRLLKAIAGQTGDPRSASSTAVAGVAPGMAVPPVSEAERRHVSVMFADLVGSTALAERLDPEEMRQILHEFHRAATGAIEAHDGHLASYLGDGILVYFGYPRAHEDDAARAVRAGLGIIAAMRAANTTIEARHGVRLQVRIGLHTGLVVAGEIGAGASRDGQAIVGETPNIAARLQSLAAPDTLVVGAATQRLVEGLFLFEDLGKRQLKGMTEPIRLYRVLAASNAVNRFDARAQRGLTPLVGRAAELEMLRQRWAQAGDGEMRCVLLVGDPGIGKSRTLRAFRDGLAPEPHDEIVLHCSPYHQNSAFWPVLERLRQTLHRVGEAESEIEALEEFASDLGAEIDGLVPILAGFLGLDTAGRLQAIDPGSLLFKQRLLDALIAMIAAMARRRPVLLLLEDAHWIDPSTLEFLRLVQERLTGSRLLLLITARPEFKPGWSFPHVLQVNLDRLSRRDRVAMVERLTGGKSLPAAVLDQIIARTDGIPLFVEELTKTILDGGGLRDAGEHYELARADWTMAIPDTLQGSLLARLDRLDAEAKGIAQVGAVIGREFRRDLLELVAGRGSEALDAALGRLLAAEIIVPAPASARIGGAFLFRHALIQEAAYQSLLLSRRARYHAAIADALERHFMDVVETQPEILAQHLTAASLPDRAIDYWLRAGKRSVSRAFFAEAVAQLRRGLHLVQQLPGGSAAQGPRSLPLLLILGRAQTETLGQIARKTFRDAVEIARQFRLPGAFAQAALSFEEGHRSLQSSQLDAVPLLEEALAGLGPDADDVDRCRVLSRLARALQNIGSFERATEINRLALPLAQRLNDARALHDASVCELLLHGVNPIRAAQFAQRQRRLDEFVAQGGTLGDFPLIVEALTYVLPFELEMGSYDRFYTALKRLETFTKASQSRLYPIVTATAQTMRLILLGDFAAAEQSADDAFQTGEGIAPGQWAGVYGMQMFTIRREQGRLAEVAPLLKRFVDENPENSAWRPGLMLIASDLGFERPARAALDEMAATKFNLPRDGKYPITMSYLAETCARLKDLPRAEMVYERLLPYRDLAIVVPATTLCCGAAARYLGLLAATLERWELAEEHFEAALVVNERLRAAPFLAHTQAEYADALLARGRDGDLGRAKELRAAATTTAERLGMAALLRRLGGQADTP